MVSKRMRLFAQELLDELEASSHEVVLVPAPEPKHSDHKIRVLQSANAAWYSRYAAENVSCRGIGQKRMKRPRTYVRKDFTIQVLRKIIEGKPVKWQGERLLEFMRREYRRRNKKSREVNVYERNPDMPF